MTSRLPTGLAIALLTILLVVPSATLGEEDGVPLGNETIVRLFVSGTSADELVRRIEGSDTDFDVSDEMLEEMRLAGLPSAVVDAMVARQKAMERKTTALAGTDAEPEPAEESPAPELVLRIRGSKARNRSESDDEEPAAGGRGAWIRMPTQVPSSMADLLQIEAEDPRVADIAIYVACLTDRHVPDHWRGKSSLGRDFITMPRHRLLAFVPGAEPAEPGKLGKRLSKIVERLRRERRERQKDGGAEEATGPEVLQYELPGRVEVALTGEPPHRIQVGLAIEIEGRFYRVSSDDLELSDLTLTADGLDVEVDEGLDDRAMGDLGVRFVTRSR